MNTFLDPHWADEEKKKTMAQVYAAAPEAWKKDAYNAVRIAAFLLPEVISDDVWKILWKPQEPRALGPIMGAMARAGWIQTTGKQEKTAQVTRHNTGVNVWKSLVYDKAPSEWQPTLNAWKSFFQE